MRSALLGFVLVGVLAVEARAQVTATITSSQNEGSYVPGDYISGTFGASLVNTDPNQGYLVSMYVSCFDPNTNNVVATASTSVWVPKANGFVPGLATGTLGCSYTVPTSGYSYDYTMYCDVYYVPIPGQGQVQLADDFLYFSET